MAIIQYGYLIPNDYPFVWDKFAGGIDEWWETEVNEFKPTVMPFDGAGKLSVGRPKNSKALYWQEYKAHIEKYGYCPICVQILNAKESVIGLEETFKVAEYDFLKLEKEDLEILESQEIKLNGFLTKWDIKVEGKPHWYLSNYDNEVV